MKAVGYGNFLCLHTHICCHLSHITLLRFFVFDLVLIQIFFCLECLFANNIMFPLLVIMAFGNKKFKEAEKEQNFELRTGNNWKKNIDVAKGRNTVCCKQ